MATSKKRRATQPTQPTEPTEPESSFVLTQEMIDAGKLARSALAALNHLMMAMQAAVLADDPQRKEELRPLWDALVERWKEARDGGVLG